jgi:5-methyltetrahydropteroyltriglutamate--homocysteine methyltransferase
MGRNSKPTDCVREIFMQRSTERILTTHTGSLPRPDALEQAMLASLEGGPRDAEELQYLVREATISVIRRQADCGVDVVNDGEVGKPSYATYVEGRLTGFGGESGPMNIQDFSDYPGSERALMTDPGFAHLVRPACTGPVRRRDDADAATAADISLLKEALEGVQVTEAFMTAVSPATISMFLENQHYPDEESYLYALADAMKPEYKAIVDAGLVLQVDCPDLGCAQNMYPGASEDEITRKLPLHVDVLNYALGDLPPDRMRMHVCWGNYDGPHHRDIELRKIVGTVLRARPDGLVLEGANPRHEHEWQVFEDLSLPNGKILMPGVIDSTNNYIEHPELVAQRLVRYANVVGKENVMAASDCGFGTLVGMRATAPSVAWAKMETMARGAELATRELWSGRPREQRPVGG